MVGLRKGCGKFMVAGMVASLAISSVQVFEVNAAYVSPTTTASVKMGLITNTSGLNVRNGPGTNYARIGGVYKNDTVQIAAQQGDWYKIKFGTGYGYINKIGVQIISTPPEVIRTGLITNPSGLNVRNGPGTNYARIGGVYKNDRIQIVSQQGDWYKIKFGTSYGYINNLGVQIIVNEPYTKATEVINYAKSWLNKGITYKMGGTNLTTGGWLDCSSYVQQVFKKYGVSLPRTTWEQVSNGKKIGINDLQPGDLVFFNTYSDSYWNRKGNYSSHVGIYLGNNQFINCMSSGGIKIQTLKGNGYWDKIFTQARRVL